LEPSKELTSIYHEDMSLRTGYCLCPKWDESRSNKRVRCIGRNAAENGLQPGDADDSSYHHLGPDDMEGYRGLLAQISAGGVGSIIGYVKKQVTGTSDLLITKK
jgi:hypothetical protein